jgi:hypothetical protein
VHVKIAFLLCAMLAASSPVHPADQVQRGGQRGANTWAARSSSGLTLGGTWTATEDPKTGTVTGTWTLLNAQGRTTVSGAWSAAKSPSGWTGNWRAAAAGRPGEYSGTWTAAVDLKGGAGFADLFAKAAQSAVSGTWRAGRQSGAWTIRVME